MTETTISPEQLQKFVQRILDLKDKQDLAATIIREVYSEVRTAGFDKQALGQLVTCLRKKGRDPDKFEAASAVFELYKKIYEGPSHAHAREEDIQPEPPRADGNVPSHAHAREEDRPKAADASPATTDQKVLEAGPELAPGLIDADAAESTGTLQHLSQSASDASKQVDPPAPIFSPRHGELRPLCRNPDNCAGYGRTACRSCLRASVALAEPAAVSDFTDAGFARLQRSMGGDAS